MCSGCRCPHDPPAVVGKLRGIAVTLLLANLLVATPVCAQIVAGRVIDAASSEPVDGVTIELADTLGAVHRTVVSNAAGGFIIPVGAPGKYRFRASRLGYATIQTPPVAIADGEVVEIEVRLDVEAVELEPLTVVVRRSETQRERDLRGLYARAEQYGEPHLGSVQIYTRESLAAWDPYSLKDAFEIYVRWRPSASDCDPRVFLDGRRQYGPFLADIGSMSVSNIEGIELYAGGGPARSRFWDPNGCGVVLVWTRWLPGDSGPLDLIDVLALAGAAALLTLQALGLLF